MDNVDSLLQIFFIKRHLICVGLRFSTAEDWWRDGAIAEQQTCDSQVVGSSPGWAALRSGLAQATYTCVPLSPSSIVCTGQVGDLFGWESNRGPGEK